MIAPAIPDDCSPARRPLHDFAYRAGYFAASRGAPLGSACREIRMDAQAAALWAAGWRDAKEGRRHALEALDRSFGLRISLVMLLLLATLAGTVACTHRVLSRGALQLAPVEISAPATATTASAGKRWPG